MTSEPRMRTAYIYMQLQGTAEAPGNWVTAGRMQLRPSMPGSPGMGDFQYAPSYVAAGHTLALDPINLPVPDADHRYAAPRYGGLIDAVRDACPDSWGRQLLLRAGHIGPHATDFEVALASQNSDRWGALMLGTHKRPSSAHAQQPALARLDELLTEIQLLERFQPPANASLRKQLLERASGGGARPKVTLRDGRTWWIAKPLARDDTLDIPVLEHASLQLANAVGLRTAESRLLTVRDGQVILVKRFDRDGNQRLLCLSAASLMQVTYPWVAGSILGSYGELADAMRRIGCPAEDLVELWLRAAFNVVIGNDDDHPRNHAVVFDTATQRWRLSPAFDLVPNAYSHPKQLAMPLLPGDLLLTGSPAGNGQHWRRFLQDGDVMTGSITGLGTQVVRCVAQPTEAAE